MIAATYPHTPGHKGTSDTGRIAAERYAPKALTKRAKILEQLAHGPQTAEQIAEALRDHWYLTRPRLSELKALGLAIETGEHGTGALGGRVNVWRTTTAEEQAEHAAREAEKVEQMARALNDGGER
jgi:predicted ArsR family transcriptional regulator